MHAWTHCLELMALTPTKALIRTDTRQEDWTAAMDALLAADPDCAVLGVRWRPARYGGRPMASPTELPAALAATRRRKGRAAAAGLTVSELRLRGEVGLEDAATVRRLLTHVAASAGVTLTEAPADRDPRAGEFMHRASRDPSAPPGRARIILAIEDSARTLHNALHGRVVQVGADLVAVELHNGLEELANRRNRTGGAAPAGPATTSASARRPGGRGRR